MLIIVLPIPFLLIKRWSTDQSFTVYLSIFKTNCSCSQALIYSSGVSDLRLEHHDSTESADPLQGLVNHSPVRVIVNRSTVAQMIEWATPDRKVPGSIPLYFNIFYDPKLANLSFLIFNRSCHHRSNNYIVSI